MNVVWAFLIIAVACAVAVGALLLVRRRAPAFPRPAGGELTGELVCYGRSVVNGEWDRMRAGTQGDAINQWGVALFRTLRAAQPKTATQQSAYDKWRDQ